MIVRLSIVLILLVALFFEMSEWAPNRVGVRNIHLASEAIPQSFDNVSIAVISDINSSTKNLKKAQKHYHNMQPDILIFTGDLFEETSTDELALEMSTLLKSMDAPLGKFAMLSPNDIESTRQLLVDAGFTIVTNNSFNIYNKTNEAIRFTFYDSTTPVPYPKETQYAIGFAYDANTFDIIKDDAIDVFVGGKTLGGGINLPFIGSLTQAGRTNKSSQQGPTRVLVSQGIGTPGDDYRLLSSPELLILSLEHTPEPVIPEPTPVEPEVPEEDTPVPEQDVSPNPETEETPPVEEERSEDDNLPEDDLQENDE